MNPIALVEHWLLATTNVIPLELFVLLGSFVEEILAPIPSPVVMTTAGAVVHARNLPWITLALIALIGAVGKTAGAWILYFIADKLEDALIPRFGHYLGVTHAHVEALGVKIGKGWKDDIFLLFARSLPIIPSAPISIASGLIKLDLRTYLWTTFAGTTIRNSLYLALGYLGLSQGKQLLEGAAIIENIVQLLLLASVGILITWAYWRRRKNRA